jgi:hypothetical protein
MTETRAEAAAQSRQPCDLGATSPPGSRCDTAPDIAFSLSWLLRDVPLRETAGAPGVGKSFAAPRVAGWA